MGSTADCVGDLRQVGPSLLASFRRELLDCVIVLDERHLRRVVSR